MLELHPVRNLGQRIDAREIANPFLGASPLSDVLCGIDPVAGTIVIIGDDRTCVRHRDGFSVLALENGVPRQSRWRVVGQRSVLGPVDQEIDRGIGKLVFLVTQQVHRRRVDAFDASIITCDDDRFVHAREDAVDVVARMRRRAQLVAHVVEHFGQCSQLIVG